MYAVESRHLVLIVSTALISAGITSWVWQKRRQPTNHFRARRAPCSLKKDPFDSSPRVGYLSWDDYFMAVAFLSAQRSKDPNKQVGACIVGRDNIILGIGYNGFPRGCHDSKLPWAKLSRDGSLLATKYPYVVHAEANCILNAKSSPTLDGATIFVTMFPCNECAKLIIQAGISTVVYFEEKQQSHKPSTARRDEAYQASCNLLSLARVKLRHHRLKLPIVLDEQNTTQSITSGEGIQI